MNWIYIKTGQISACLLCLLCAVQLSAAGPIRKANTSTIPPVWTVNPDDYEFSMNAVIRVRYAGVPSNAAGNIVGAFVGNELRGVATPTVISGNAYFFLTIYSNEYHGETVHFKAYIAPQDEVFGALESVTFVHNLNLGIAESPFWINIDPNADFPPELEPILADTTLQNIPFDPIVLGDYLYSGDGDPVTWSAQPGPNLTVNLVNGVLTVAAVSNTWIGTDSVRIIVKENTPGQLADTVTAWFTVLEDYGAPAWLGIPDQSIFQGDVFSSFDLDDYLDYSGPCRGLDFEVFPFSGTAPDPAWPVVAPGSQPMSIVARPLFADIPLAGAGAKLAAFVNGNLAGWAPPTGIAPNISYSLLLKNVGAGAITFKFYDAANQYLYEETTSLIFSAGASVGTIASPYLIQLSPLLPMLDANGVFSMTIDDPTWLGDYPVQFISWDCDYPDLRRDTTEVVFSITTNIQPEISSGPTVTFQENACSTLYDAQTSDPNNSEGNGLSYSLDGGADANRFAINAQTGILAWANGFSPDFENPQDANADNQYEVNIKVTNAANLSDVLALTVSISNQTLEPFSVSINNGASVICSNGAVDLQASGGVAYVWSNGSTQATIQVSAAGTYTVTATSSGACTASASILIAPKPLLSAAGNNGLVCIGANIQLTSTPSAGTAPYTSFNWSGPNNYSANVEDPTGFPATAASAGVYTVTMTDAAGCTATASVSIAVSGNSAPAVAAGSNSPLCEGASLALNATPSGGSGGGYSFLWSGPNNYAAAGQSPAPFPATQNAAGTYTVTLTDGAGCTGTGTNTVIVYPKPVITAGNNSPVSVGGSILLSSVTSGGSGSGYTYQWSGPNNYTATVAQPAGFTASLASAGVYIVTVTDSNGCTGTATTTVNVVTCPSISASVNAAVCENGLVTLQSTPAGGALPYVSFAWSGPNNYLAAVEDPAPFQAGMSANGLYTVVVTDQLGCSATASVTVVVHPNPSVTAQNNGPMCAGGTVVLTSTPAAAGYSFVWSGPDFFSANTEDPAPFTGLPGSSGIYTVKVTDASGCTATATTSLVVNAKPGITATNNGPLCIGANLNLQSTPTGGSGVYAAFSWAGPSSYSSNLEDPTPFPITLAKAGTYTVTVTDNQGCSATASTTVSVSTNNAPGISATSNSPLCAGNQLTLNSTPNAGTPPYTTFTWAGPNSYSASQEDPTPFTVFANGAGIYGVTVTDSKGCKGTATVTVNVVAPPLNPGSNSPICPGSTLQLTSGGASGQGITYSWTGPNNFTAAVSDPSIPNATTAASGVYTVTMNDNGCIGTSTVTVSVADGIPPNISCPANVTLNANASCNALLGSYSAVSLSDNCNANPTVTQSPAASTVLTGHNAAQTVTLTANDGNGNTNACTFTVTLKDVTPPSITCPANTTLSANAACSNLLGTYNAAAVSDNCNPSPTVMQSPAASTVLTGHNSVQTVTLTANDGNGNTQFCNFTVTLKDLTKPSITCPANTTLAADASCSSLLGGYNAASVSDNCNPSPTVMQSPAASTVLTGHNSVQTVTLTANDGNGNTQFCNFTVTLKDVTKPGITCPANITLAADAACSSLLGSYNAASVSDNCNPSPSMTQSPAASTVLTGHNAAQTVTLTANDSNGNSQFCTFTVTLKDLTKPSITCPANTTLAADAACSSLLGNYNAESVSDNCNPNPAVTQSPAASTVLNGHNDVETVTLTANDGNGNTQFCTFTVTLKDVTKPSITCPANTTLAADATCSSLLGNYNAVSVSDNCNPSPSVTQSPAASTVLNGHNDLETVTLTANDGNGNTQFCTFTVTLKDVTKPSITCPANTTLAADATCSSLLGTYNATTVSDNCNPSPAVTQSPVASSVLNGHNDLETVTLTANDGNGNTQFCTFTVTLKDVTKPTVVCKPYTAALNAAGNASITTANVFQSGSDNCGVVNQVSVVQSTFTCANLGANTVVLTVNDGNGNTNTCNATVTVVDLIPPTMVCKTAVTYLNSQGIGSITAADVNNNSTDNCTLATMSVSPSTFNCANVGTNVVTLTGTDQSGNTGTCQSTVTVRDTIKPTMLCRNATLNLNAAGQATLTIANVDNGSFDNCGISSFSLSQTQFTCANLGANTVILSGTDPSGNKGTCSSTVTVQDLLAPVAKCKNITYNLGATGTANIPASAVDNSSTDNCSFNLSMTPSTFNCTNLGLNIVTLKATDASGNTGTCTARITIKDVTPPTALCKNFTIYLNDVGKATLTTTQIDNGSFDNCSIVTSTMTLTQFSCADIGAPVNNFLTVKDASGNSATCTAIITVKDNLAPTPVCHDKTVLLGPNGMATVYPAMLADSSFDNCSVTTYLPAAKTYVTPGVFNLNITVKDWSGNASNCVSVITVLLNNPNERPADVAGEAIPGGTGKLPDGFKTMVFPNPADGLCTLEFELPMVQEYTIAIHDLTGKLHNTQKGEGIQGINQVDFDFTNAPAGIYLVSIRSRDLSAVHRLMVQH